jgi:hypothetical protein
VPRFDIHTAAYGVYIFGIGTLIYLTYEWDPLSTIAPLIVAYTALIFAVLSFINHTFRREAEPGKGGPGTGGGSGAMHFDTSADDEGLPQKVMLTRAAAFFGWLLAFMGSVALVGFIPTVFMFVVAYMRLEAREPWRLVAISSVAMTLFCWGLFEKLLLLPWPATVVGDWFPVLRDIVPSM